MDVVEDAVHFPLNNEWKEICLKKIHALIDKTIKAKVNDTTQYLPLTSYQSTFYHMS